MGVKIYVTSLMSTPNFVVLHISFHFFFLRLKLSFTVLLSFFLSLSLSFFLSLSHKHTHTYTHTRAYTQTHSLSLSHSLKSDQICKPNFFLFRPSYGPRPDDPDFGSRFAKNHRRRPHRGNRNKSFQTGF